MSDARAMQATERCRDLVANPQRMGLKPRAGLEPLDVVVKFNRPAAHTRSAFQVVVQMKLSLDGSGNPPFTDAKALVAEGRTEAEALEMFFNWMADEDAVMRFVEVVKASQLDALAKQALDAKAAEDRRINQQTKERTHEWLAKKFDALGRAAGVIKPKVTLS